MKRMKNLFKGAVLAFGLFFTASVANAQQKIAHINAQEIFQLTPEYQAAQAQIKTLSDTKRKELEGMYTEFQKKQTEGEEKLRNRSEANKAQVDAELQALGQELQTMQERIQEIEKVAQGDIQKKNQELMAPIETKLITAINAVATEKGYAYIFDIGTGAAIYFQGGIDASADVKAKLGIK
jgi:outer membrane protein